MMYNIQGVLQSGSVERFHAVPGVANQLVGQHSWGVAVLLLHLFPSVSKELLAKALTHDCAELKTGDIPATLKWSEPDIKNSLDLLEKHIEHDWGIDYECSDMDNLKLKLCDALEGAQYCVSRLSMGERAAAAPLKEWLTLVWDKYVNPDDGVFNKNTRLFKFYNSLGQVLKENGNGCK